MRKLMFLFLALSFATAAAQGELPGVPADWQPVLTLAIGLLSSLLVGPMTAIAKKLGCTTGPTTVAVSAVMSLLVTFGFSLWQSLATQTGMPWGQAFVLALIAFLKSNGDYISRVFSTAKGQGAPEITVNLPAQAPVTGQPAPAPMVVGEVTPPADVKLPPGNLEFVPGLDTRPLGLMSAAPEQGIEVAISQLLTQAGMQATPQQLVRVAARLAVTAPHLMDSAHLDEPARARILETVLELKAGGAL